ncbi:unnamed protein product [Chironomus riparius]|uniref:Uncharacterized protein n=1 Tax=Chironomus riparius TaxID=315576 RepID=A0A9N9WYX3_9DIPT|nr:unnamed protein product [Chironomus riparius]
MNWKLLLLTLILILGISARPADDNAQEISTLKSLKETTNLTERPTVIVTDSPIEIVTKKIITKTAEKVPVSDSIATSHVPTTTSRYEAEDKPADENRELKADTKLQLTSGNVNSEITLKESFHHGVAVPLSLEDYEKELAREKDLLTKAKKKISIESSTPKEGISTWILLSGSNNPTTTSRSEVNKPAYRVDNDSKKPVVKNNISSANSTQTTKKRTTATQSPKSTKTTVKYTNNKLATRVKVTPIVTEEPTTISTTKKVPLTTKTKKFTTQRPKTTQAKTTTTVATTTVELTTAASKKKESQKEEKVIIDDSMVIDDEKDEPEFVETSTYLIMEAKDDEFNLPNDRSPSKSVQSKKAAGKTTASPKNKKKKIAASVAAGTNSTTKIKKKSDKKTDLTKVSNNKKPEKPITTQIYNYLAREVMPTVGVGLVGLVVTAGLATYFLGGPLTALRRSYDIASRRDDVGILDRSDDFGNMQDEGEMFGKVIAGMPENSPYRNNIRVNSYHVKNQQYPSYPGPQYGQQPQQINKYGIAPQQAAQQLKQQQYQQQIAQQQIQQQPIQPQAQSQQQQYLRYRAADPYYNSYPKNQYYPQQVQPKSNNYGPQAIQAAESAQKFNIDSVDMTTSEPSSSPYSMDYDEIAQSYFPQHDDEPSPASQITIDQQKMQEIESKPQPQYVQPMESERSEKVTIINAQSVPTNHKNENDHDHEHEQEEESPLPTPEALKMPNLDEEYQNSIANAILSQNQKKFVVGSVIADNFEENAAGSVPEHGPRRRRKREASKKPAAKSLDNNEIDEDERVEKPKRDTEAETEIVTTTLSHESATHELENDTTIEADKAEETTFSTSTPTYDISPGQNNIFNLFRRIVELKLRLGLNFLQNATLAFQEYLRGVEARVHASPLFNPYKNSTNSTDMSRKSSKLQRKKVENL